MDLLLRAVGSSDTGDSSGNGGNGGNGDNSNRGDSGPPLPEAPGAESGGTGKRGAGRRRVDVNAPHEDGSTALWIAAHQGHAACVERLLQEPTIDVNARTLREGSTYRLNIYIIFSVAKYVH